MVVGLDHFKAFFKEFNDQYVLIGGAACYAQMEDAGDEFRATKDLDIVLCIEALSQEFAAHFTQYIKQGGYAVAIRQENGRKLFFRFKDPTSSGFPKMLELFSRRGNLDLGRYPSAAPLDIEEGAESLSALLLNDDYYAFIMQNKEVLDDLSVASPICLIALKARAWLDLSRQRSEGEDVHRNDVDKHKKDVFRLLRIMNPNPPQPISIAESIKIDLSNFVAAMESEIIENKTFLLQVLTRHFGI